MLSGAQLARAARTGDTTSLGILLERHRAPLYALDLQCLGPGSEAEDAVQDAFLTALRAIDRLREPEAVGGWLRRLREAPRYLRPSRRAAPRAPPPGLCRLVGMVISTHTKRLSARMPYTEVQSVLDEDYPDGWRYYWKSQNISGFSDEVIGRLVTHAEAAPSDHSTIDVWYKGGAMSRTEASETAFGDRSAPIWLGVEANWEDPKADEANISWVRECVADMQSFSGGAYLNYPGFFEEGDRLIRKAFGENYERLVALKRRYDPTNLFRLNQNKKPNA